jgi:hypothetical protein
MCSTVYIDRFDWVLFYIYIFYKFFILLMILYRQVSESVVLYFILLFMIRFAVYRNVSKSVHVILTELYQKRSLFTI